MQFTQHGALGFPNRMHPRYQDVLDAARINGYTLPSSTVQVKQSALMSALIDGGILSELDRFCCFATDGSADFAGIDWVSPLTTGIVTPIGSPTFVTNSGFETNGSSSYVRLRYQPSTNGVKYTLNDNGFFLYNKKEITTAAVFDFGASTNGAKTTALSTRRTATNTAVYANNQSSSLASTLTTYTSSIGLYVVKRYSSTSVELFKNGVSDGLKTSTTTSLTDSGFYMGARNNPSVAGADNAVNFCDGRYAFWGIGSSNFSVSLLQTALDNYYNSL